MILRIRGKDSLNSINGLIFIMETQCIYNGLGTELLNPCLNCMVQMVEVIKKQSGLPEQVLFRHLLNDTAVNISENGKRTSRVNSPPPNIFLVFVHSGNV
jgi:hypothetical protein